MKFKLIAVTLLAIAVSTNAGNISTTTGLDANTPWIEVLQKLDTGRATLTLVTPALGAATFTTLAHGADPADAGVIRLANADVIAWEASPASTDVTLTVNSSEQFVFSAAILSPTFVTPALGTPASGVITNCTGSPTLTAPILGTATGTSVIVTGALHSSGPTGGIGYITGAGGTVTQITSRTTTVVLNRPTGQITTTADSMAALTPTTFTVTNSSVAATDNIVLTKVSGDIDTVANVNSIGSGSFTVTLYNRHATDADTTAFVFNFIALKGSTN